MKPINFSEANTELKKPKSMTSDECQPLPVFRNGSQCISCWRPTWRERLSILIYGKVWLRIYGSDQPPVTIRGYKTAFIK